MIAQRLLIGGLALAALVLVGIHPNRMLSGYIEREPMCLAAPISGQLTQVSVQRGDRVEAGRPPFVVDERQPSSRFSPRRQQRPNTAMTSSEGQ